MQEMAEMTPGWAEITAPGSTTPYSWAETVTGASSSSSSPPGPYEVYLGLPFASSVGLGFGSG